MGPERSALLVSLDLDDAWAYQRVAGRAGWQDARTVLPLITERYLAMFDELGITATVFAVGKDAATPHGAETVRAFADAGHEIANHSWDHRGELPRGATAEIIDELARTDDVLGQLTGRVPRGFRCPSFGASPALTDALHARGYHYDASALPTSIVPLLRLINRVQHGTDVATYGSWRTAVAPQRPLPDGHGMLNVPTTTMPFLRLPAHGSYLSAVAGISPGLARAYAKVFDVLARSRRLDVSFLLHASDVLDRRDAPQMGFFPGMQVAAAKKRDLVVDTLDRLKRGRMPASIGTYDASLV